MADTTWFTHDRFGMFIHWGLYSVPAGVWKGKKIRKSYSEWLQASVPVPRAEYRELAKSFNPSRFNADEWIRAAKQAGMRYFLITAKHHDGFCLWPTRVSDYNVVDATPFGRDILGELATACREHGIKLGFYYSHWMDWDGTGGDVSYQDEVQIDDEVAAREYTHPSQEAFEAYWQGKCLPQVRELIESYDPAFLWFDTWGKYSSEYMTPRRQEEMIGLVHSCSSSCLVNSRINFESPSDRCDYLSMMDNCYPNTTFEKAWETSGTLNHSWAYHKLDYEWKSTGQLIKYLVGNASLGGNYQLNVGPMPDGTFQPAALRRLREIGCWMDVNGESIYGTAASPVGTVEWGRITIRKAGEATLWYLHLWNVTPGTALFVNGLVSKVTRAIILESGQPVRTQTSDCGTWVSFPKEASGLLLPVIKVEVDPRG